MTSPRTPPFPAALQAAASQLSDGTHQQDRAPAALAADHFLVDETTVHQRLHQAAQFARQVHFYDANDKVAGHWGGLFSKDEALLLACIARGDGLQAAADQGAALADAHLDGLADGVADGRAATHTDVHAVARRATLIARWQQQLQAVDGAAARRVSGLISELVSSRLALALRHALRGAPQAAAGLQPVLATLGEAWGLRLGVLPQDVLPQGVLPQGDVQKTAANLPDEPPAHDAARASLALMDYAIARVRDMAQAQFVLSQNSGEHDGAAALVLALAQLQSHAQEQLNGFTERLINFYHDDVLRLRPKAPQADSVHLVAQCAGDAGVLVPQGTAFVAGPAAGQNADDSAVLFMADESVQLSSARVAALCTLRLERDRYISPEVELDYVNRAWAQALPVAGAPGAAAPTSALHWPLFGGSQEQQVGGGNDAQMGLALAAPELLLCEGEREVRVQLRLGQAAWMDPRLLALATALRRSVHEPSAPDALPPPKALTALFQAYIDGGRQAVGQPSAAVLAQHALPQLQTTPCTALDCFRAFLVQRALHSRGAAFRTAAGQLFAHWLLSSPADVQDDLQDDLQGANVRHDTDLWLSEEDRATLKQVAQATLQNDDNRARWADSNAPVPGDPLSLFIGSARPDRGLLFSHLFTGLFEVSVSTASGWHSASESYVLRDDAATLKNRPAQGDAPHTRLHVVTRLSASEPAVMGCVPAVHGKQWGTGLPVLRLRLRAFGGVYAYSLLESALLLDATLTVQVRGLRQLSLHNSLGQLDAGKPFSPFGPLPVQGSFLVVGAAELACKRVTQLTLNLQWSGLPAGPGGFASHYIGYPSGYTSSESADINNASFRVNLSVLRDGQWLPHVAAAPSALFAAESAQGALLSRSSLTFDTTMLRNYFRASRATRGELLGSTPPFDTRAHNGFVRVQLAAPAAAFGHADHPQLLAQAMTAKLRKRSKVSLPKSPYTPQLEGLSADYSAECVVQPSSATPSQDDTPDTAAPRLYHLLPFGVQCVHPRPVAGLLPLLPRVTHDGNLCIGVAAQRLQGRLSLLFHLHAEAAQATAWQGGKTPALHWLYLMGDTWRRLPAKRVLSDSTMGFLTSGLVVLDVPAEIDTEHSIMPTGLHWLAVCADGDFEGFAALHSVYAQGLRATRVLPDTRSTGLLHASQATWQALPANTVGLPAKHLPGLIGVQQIGASFAGRSGETRQDLRVRAGERLRHRQRALLPWDYERLLLERFPDVAIAKCFAASQWPAAAVGSSQTLAPGQVLLAVMPTAARFDRAAGRLYPHLNAIELREMEDFLRQHAPAQAQLRVRNAAYERIQLHCAVGLQDGAAVGDTLARVDRALFDFISPWVEGGLRPRFGWVLRQEDIEAHLRSVAGVAFVTGLSMLHVAQNDDGYFALRDTAAKDDRTTNRIPRTPQQTSTVQRVEVRPLVPWSVAVPMAQHRISALRQRQAQTPVPSGVSALAIGSNFIIGGPHG